MQSLYVIKCQEYFKIGVANDVEARLAQLSTGNPYPLEVQVIYQFDNAEIVERALHQKLKANRVRGEWFSLSLDEQNEIHKICLSLGGSAFEYSGEQVTDEIIEEAEDISHQDDGGKWDYKAMFSDGWRMATQGRGGKYWNWRRGENNQNTIYGGRISDLPYPMDEMRKKFGSQNEE